jgi:hypothetical protein
VAEDWLFLFIYKKKKKIPGGDPLHFSRNVRGYSTFFRESTTPSNVRELTRGERVITGSVGTSGPVRGQTER